MVGQSSTKRHFDAKQDILVEDDEEDDDVYLIRSGKATVIIGGGSEVILGEGDLIGEMSFLAWKQTYSFYCCKRTSLCWSVSISDMDKVFQQDPPLSARFYKALGSLLALRLVNSSKRATQNLIFQENDDALISLMSIQTREIQRSLERILSALFKINFKLTFIRFLNK